MDAQQPTGSAAGSPDPLDTSADAAIGAVPTTGRRARVLTVVKWVAAVVALAFLVWSIARQWDAISRDFVRLDAGTIVLGVAATIVALVANMLSWRAMMSASGFRVRLAAASSIFFVGQLGKYIPGGVWSIAAQAELGRAHGLQRTGSAVAALASMLVSMVTAAVVGIVAVLLASSTGFATFWWLIPLIVVGLVCLTPPVLGRLIAVAFRILRRPAQDTTLTWTGTVMSLVWSLVMWLAYGVQATLVLRVFGADSPTLFPVAVGAYAVAWLVGFVVVIAPAGIGPREGTLVLLLGSVAGGSAPLALAVISRVFMTIGDVVLAGVGALLAARHRRKTAAAALGGGAPGAPRAD
ncbi:flippase-like domain-containing protein [Curtobacterium flaccumfaciens pv. flaccumfaciens]|uniref:lysylphosphatidylglycerol synthase transmembrane domain-containing protein n=1 Tax=Curtobacterium flaccumfaciens TaxID=2035 RepID=UPI002657B413|nr:YbhN family protein [Curtobacterium flaccumfaciens]MCS5508059.1 flippase-like domain-containing protein [Curtobacterium flaccumfaciens pv. flaccumfaciens]MCX2785324.1 YbhN family protein [Curtobacterium flaccumfaciens pv. flaccumfaciens]